jgi:hypothetical protein
MAENQPSIGSKIGAGLTNLLTKTTRSIAALKEDFVGNTIFAMIIVMVIAVGLYYRYMSQLSSRECSLMDSLYQTNKSYIHSVDYSLPDYSYTLKDYYIKTAYNCCSGGAYKNDYVSICALKNVIKQGARCLDFEIYSIDDSPVVATSTVPNYFVKETYNSVPFAEVMSTIVNYGFGAGSAPNSTDPILLHLRIKSTNQKMLTAFANIFKSYNNYLMGSHYSYEYTYNSGTDGGQYYTHNMGDVTLSQLKGNKIVIIVDRLNTAFIDNESFYEYVNMTSNSVFMRALNFYDVRFTPDMNELQTYNKQNMTIALPDTGSDPPNPAGTVCRQMGCQMTAMKFQTFDAALQESLLFFDQAGSAFVLKPANLRFQQATIPETPANPPELSFETRSKSLAVPGGVTIHT